MTNFIDIYGHCSIPKNTLLYRGHPDDSFTDSMFFATKRWIAGAFYETVQIWKTTKEIQVLFLVDYLDARSWTTSSLPTVYNNIFPDEAHYCYSDLGVKQHPERRAKLIEQLHSVHNASGWLTSVEDRIEIEICLFDKYANSSQLVLVEKVLRTEKKYYRDSLKKLRITPSQSFYEKTTEHLKKSKPWSSNNTDFFKEYRRREDHWIKKDIEDGMTRAESTHFNSNLRIKLKI